jgi:N4-(beta-N-acetylglucosaminyl)-L-asparaginase
MEKTLNRRNFLKKFVGISISAPFILRFPSQFVVAKDRDKLPVLLCSRGKEWGKKVLEPAWAVLIRTGNILDSVEKGANVVELDPEDSSVGYGGLPNEDGIVQLDASIMYGPNHNCGSVACLENIKTPSSVARVVMERTDHIMLAGEDAKKFAIMHGFKEENLLTEKARIEWLKWKENMSKEDDWLPPASGKYKTEKERITGTINLLGISREGDIAGITTTSGLAWKIPGRIGDSPIIGAGLYLDNEVGAAGATGRGEEVIRTCGSFYVVEKMREGISPQKACETICKRIIDINGGPKNVNFNDKFIAVNKQGAVGCAAIRGKKGKEPLASYINEDGFKQLKGTYLLELK